MTMRFVLATLLLAGCSLDPGHPEVVGVIHNSLPSYCAPDAAIGSCPVVLPHLTPDGVQAVGVDGGLKWDLYCCHTVLPYTQSLEGRP